MTLAAAQHALAREYGVDTWPTLVRHIESLRPEVLLLATSGVEIRSELMWSAGRGSDVWKLIQACVAGDLDMVRALIPGDPSLARLHYDYRKPLYFAVREDRIEVVRFLLEHDHNPLDLWVDDDAIDITRDRGYTEMEQLLADTFDTRGSTPRRKASRSRWR